MTNHVMAFSAYLGSDGNFISFDLVSLPFSTVINILEITGRSINEGEQFTGDHHFLVSLDDLAVICAKRFDLDFVDRWVFSSVQEAVSRLRDLAKTRGMGISEVVEIDTFDNGDQEGLNDRARVYMKWLGIPKGKLDWPGNT